MRPSRPRPRRSRRMRDPSRAPRPRPPAPMLRRASGKGKAAAGNRDTPGGSRSCGRLAARRRQPRAGANRKPRPIRWQARDETPPGSPRRRSGVNWIGMAAVAFVLVGLIGGAGAVVTLESLTSAEPGPGAGGPAPADAAPEGDVAGGHNQPGKSFTVPGASRGASKSSMATMPARASRRQMARPCRVRPR